MYFLKRAIVGILVVSVIVLAVVMGALRLAITNIDYFKSEIEYLLERELAAGFTFTGLSGDINRFNPIVGIENVSITAPDRRQPLFIDRLAIEIDFWASWRENTLVVREVTGELEKLELVKDEAGIWSVNDVPITLGRKKGPTPEFRQVLAQVPRYLNLNLNRLIVRDQMSGDTHQLERIEARINHLQEQFFVRLSTDLPDQLGQGMVMKSIVSPERSLIYINSTNLQLIPVARLFDIDTWGFQQGALDGELWINMAAYDVLAVNGNVVIKNGLLQASPDRSPLEIEYQSRFNALNLKDRWRIANEVQWVSIDNHRIPAFSSQYELAKNQGHRIFSAWVNRLQIPSLPVIAGQWLPARFSQQLQQGQFDGLLQDVWFKIDFDQPQDYFFSGIAANVRSRAFGNYPGIENINAEVVAGNNRFGARVYGNQVSLDFGNHFNAPLQFDQITLQAKANRLDDGLVLAVDDLDLSNPDIKASGRMWLEVDQHEQPFAFIRASFSDADGSSTSKYLPRNHTPLGTQAWLDRGIKNGFVPAGEMQFHGRLRDIRELARERAGEFYVDFVVERGDVFFAPGWSNAKNGKGRVLFHNVGMDIMMDRVSYDRLDDARARVTIANFDDPVLELRIEADASSEMVLDTWLDTPVGEEYREVMSYLHDFGGGIGTVVNVQLPLQGEQPEADVEVQVNFRNSSARADDWGLDLSRVNGSLKVTREGLSARRIRARYFDDPVTINVDTVRSSGHTLVTAAGTIETSKLFNKLPDSLNRGIHGKSDWQLRLDFAGISVPKTKPFLRLSASSNLRNTRLDLPQPFAKTALSPRKASVELDFFQEQVWFSAGLGSDIRGRGQLVPDAERNFELNLLDIAFASKLKPKPRQGLHLYGSIDEVSVDDWIRFIKGSEGANSALLQSVDLSFDRALLFQRELTNVSIDLAQGEQSFVGSIDSSIVSGRFAAPWKPSPANPLIVDLDYLLIEKVDDETEEADLVPADLVDFRLDSKALVFHDMLFSKLHVDGRPVGDKLYIDNLGLQKDDLVLEGKGQWDYDAVSRSHLSSIAMTVRGENLGQALAGMGFGDSMRGGRLDFSGGFTWPDRIVAFDVDNLVGDARFRVDDGVLNNVDPGGGRFVGLFSLAALPRRLSLDFSDVFIEGMEFDEIYGTYRIEKGILTTDDSRMKGPAAEIKIYGDTDIAKRSYDQTIEITPKIRQTLPVIGAVAAGSTVGWGLLLLQSLFKKSIDEAVEVEYRVTGSWDDPKIELVKAVDENQRELPKIDK